MSPADRGSVDSDAADSSADSAATAAAKPTPAQAMLAQMGGVSGLIYSALPVAVLVPVNTAFGLVPAIPGRRGGCVRRPGLASDPARFQAAGRRRIHQASVSAH